ncbi:similar to DNA polymerase I (plasmid) [Calothrix sp. PCC 7716]|nr:similar to DNA polymerase I [Calothrix sp. PCC 7716]
MSYNPRNFVHRVKNELIVDEDKLNIFWKYPRKKNQWKPSKEIPAYEGLRRIAVDIETAGLNPDKDRILAIGAYNAHKDIKYADIFMAINEKRCLKQFVELIGDTKPDVILTYNGMSFDLPFIIKRCQIHKINHPFRVSNKSIYIETAKPYGRDSLTINPIYIRPNIEHVDVYICVLRWDNARRLLSDSKSLKSVAIELGLRPGARLTLEYQDIIKCWEEGEGSNGWEQIKEYLRYDLEDTILVSDHIVPTFYYEKYIAPSMGLGDLTIKGNGTKWSVGLQLQYPNKVPKAEPKYQFKGGATFASSGFYRKKTIALVDITGMHPWIICTYGLHSKYDVDEISLAMLDYFGEERERVKSITGLSNRQDSLKGIRNCYYGLLGTGKLPFNDMVAAALVCAHSRKILLTMLQIMEETGATILEYDTDGIYFMHENPPYIHQLLMEKLPEGIKIKLEKESKAMYIPPNGCKNYLLWTNDGKIIKKGSWTSRAKSKIENQHPIDYLTHFLQGYNAAEQYHQELIDTIQSSNYPIKNLIVRRRIKEGEIELLKIGKPKDVISYYVGTNGICTEGNYSKSYYTNLINTKRSELLQIIAPEKLRGGTIVEQLSLFST